MKIALVILHPDPRRGGAERYTLDLAIALGKAGHEVSLVHSDSARNEREVLGAIPMPFRTVALDAKGARRTNRYYDFCAALERHLDGEVYDIVHAMLPVPQCDVYHPHAGVAKALQGSFLSRLFNPRRRAFARTEQELLEGPRPPAVICLSNYVKECIRQDYPGLPNDRLAKLFNAVDLHQFDPARRPEIGAELRKSIRFNDRNVVALFVGNDFARKGLGVAILMVAASRDPKLKLLVVGTDKTKRYADLANKVEVADRVTFFGPTDDPAACYAASDILLLPTTHDPCSLVLLEALAMGVPCITTPQNGASEIMTSGKEGFVVDLDDAEGIHEAMTTMLNPDRRRSMREACLALRPQLAYETHLATLMTIYEDCLARRSPASRRLAPA